MININNENGIVSFQSTPNDSCVWVYIDPDKGLCIEVSETDHDHIEIPITVDMLLNSIMEMHTLNDEISVSDSFMLRSQIRQLRDGLKWMDKKIKKATEKVHYDD